MKYYKDNLNNVFAYELDGSQDGLIGDKVEMTIGEVNDHLTIPYSVYSCNPWQIRKVLNQLGLRQAVEDAVAASTDQTMKDGWEFATEFRSDDPFVIGMGAALGKTQTEIDQLIQLAATL